MLSGPYRTLTSVLTPTPQNSPCPLKTTKLRFCSLKVPKDGPVQLAELALELMRKGKVIV